MKHTRFWTSNTKETYSKKILGNDLCLEVNDASFG